MVVFKKLLNKTFLIIIHACSIIKLRNVTYGTKCDVRDNCIEFVHKNFLTYLNSFSTVTISSLYFWWSLQTVGSIYWKEKLPMVLVLSIFHNSNSKPDIFRLIFNSLKALMLEASWICRDKYYIAVPIVWYWN